MMKNYFSLILILFVLIFSSYNQNHTLISKVDPFIGTGGHGHTYPEATNPFGMVQLSPDTRIDDWDGCSGYHFSDSTILGFSHTHLSGTGVGDYGDIRMMPTVGDFKTTSWEACITFKAVSEYEVKTLWYPLRFLLFQFRYRFFAWHCLKLEFL